MRIRRFLAPLRPASLTPVPNTGRPRSPHSPSDADRARGTASPPLPTRWVLFGLFALHAIAGGGCRPTPRHTGPLAQDAYVWHREWNSNVVASVQTHAPSFGILTLLVAEVSFTAGQPRIVRITPDWTPFQALPNPTRPRTGLALRIGPFPGPFKADDPTTRWLRRIAKDCLAEARNAGVDIAEFQIDFDCPERHLDGYRVWVEALRTELAPVPVLITALPAWLGQRAFRPLAAATDGFVLQVHSLNRPRHPKDPVPLCDPEQARRAVERAARAGGGVPFRVALPTYGYLLAFATDGTFLGASAEGPPPARPAGTVYRELNADPAAMAQLVADWTGDRPASMTGVIWYRLPVSGDRFNWRWPTLETVMAGKVPLPRLDVLGLHPEPGLTEVQLANPGTANYTGPVVVRLRWSGAQGLGADGIRGFQAFLEGGDRVLFTNAICRLPAGEESRIGWVRLDAHVPITFEVVVPPSPDVPVHR